MKHFIEEEIHIEGEHPIYGTLTIPASGTDRLWPAVLIIAGSGPIDRNGNGPKGKFQFNLYRELAERMTELGFVVLRYDKRGSGKSPSELVSAGMWDLVDDAERGYLFLKNHPNVDTDQIIVLGHSEGTILGTALSARQDIQGLMLISGGVANLDEYLRHQRKLAYAELKNGRGFKGALLKLLVNEEREEKKANKLMEKMFKSGKDVYRAYFFIKQPAKWFKEHYAYDPRPDLQKADFPVFAIHGDKDPHVDTEILKELPELVKGNSEFHIIHNMDHGLRVQQEEKEILKLKKLYKNVSSRPFHQEGFEVLSNWLVSHYKGGS
ncbi:alpha/beta hydrolase [Falsibacillus albus]|uniref:Alpha/beta hydrolase n=2 Tax=Falsibacillus albus TaxID=2478915 RepID=A0A3L7JS34_9BACI|nr:alpha/beta hydrolase [Falsibacillus albus]